MSLSEPHATLPTPLPAHDLNVSLPLRIFIGVEALFGLMSILTIGLTPENTAEHFAWPIAPAVTAALLGGFYFASAALFVPALFVRRWQNIRAIVPAAILFTSVELIATVLHWEKFSTGTTAFHVWLASYIAPPPVFLLVYVWHQRRAEPVPKPTDEPLSRGLRLAMQTIGSLLMLLAVAMFAAPSIVIALAHIGLTPLTTRAVSGWILATGALLVFAARENDRNRARIVSPFLICVLPATALETARFADQIDFTRWALYASVLLLVIVCAIGLVLFRGDWRRTFR
jgi:hypothetical protein